MPETSPPSFNATEPLLVAVALAAGISRRRLRGRTLIAPVRGVRMLAADAGDLAARCQAIGLAMPAGAALSHASAAALWGLPLPRRIDPAAPVHVIGRAGRPPIDALAVAAHEGLDADEATLFRDVRLTTVARTGADLGAALDDTDLVIRTDAVLALSHPRTTTSELTAAMNRASGRRGCRALRRALGRARHFVDSPMETRVRLQLVASGFPLCWPSLRLAIEYDGEHHRTDRAQYARDIHRKEHMEDLGWRSIVLLAGDVLCRWSATESRLADAFASRGVRIPSTLRDEPDTDLRRRIVTPR